MLLFLFLLKGLTHWNHQLPNTITEHDWIRFYFVFRSESPIIECDANAAVHIFDFFVFLHNSAMVVVQRSIIWSPHDGQNQFLAGGTELKLYEWVPEVNDQV